ncbi:sugar phosphate isomerase/epimerase [Salinibacterium sp. ZJ450]|uniref:sugar phosphate isomerase/epimerase family protein n=1 Tax=Salinibacterium sp. ZJ450 TaxID=2708338 RepID=UPI00142177F2|nr:sugar phosphate isomerase/epimerase family protein [Salinibacterium sp. ZJ450]
MPHTSESWPIAAALHQFAHPRVQDAPAEDWLRDLREVAHVGFQHVDLTDNWLRVGDLTPERLAEFELTLVAAGLRLPAISITRRSIIDPDTAADNLAYTHRTIEAGAALGVEVLSLGLHRPFTPAQQQQLWFWNAPGASDPEHDADTWALAVSRFREIGKHAAEVGMIVSLEMYEDTYLGTADSAVRLIQDIDLPNVGLDPDIGNLVRLHRPIEDWREMLAKTLPYTNYWQVKNYYRDEDPATGAIVTHPAPLALGFINYRDAIREALALGFQGVLCCEHYGGDGLGVSAMNMQYLRTLLPQTAQAPDVATQPQREAQP